MREDHAAKGKTALFEQLKDLQPGEHGERNYEQIGASFGMSEQAVKNAVLTFRRRYAKLLRDEIAQTVLNPAEVDEELRHLMQIFAAIPRFLRRAITQRRISSAGLKGFSVIGPRRMFPRCTASKEFRRFS